MKTCLLLFIVTSLFGVPSFAEVIIGINGMIYETSLKSSWAPKINSEANLKEASFLELNNGDNSFTFAARKPISLPKFSFLKKAENPKIEKLEGCGRHPFEWLPNSKIIAKISAAADKKKLFIQVPANSTVVEKAPADIAQSLADILTKRNRRSPPYTKEDMSGNVNAARYLSNKGTTYAYIFDEDDLNQSILILEKSEKGKWQAVHSLTITDGCP